MRFLYDLACGHSVVRSAELAEPFTQSAKCLYHGTESKIVGVEKMGDVLTNSVAKVVTPMVPDIDPPQHAEIAAAPALQVVAPEVIPASTDDYLLMGDAAYADNLKGVNLDAIAGYLPAGNAFHPWSHADWKSFSNKPKLPIWVAGSAGAVTEGWNCVGWLKLFGVPAKHPVMIDMETRVDPLFIHIFTEILNSVGYWAVVYGSNGFVHRNPPRGGYVVATLDGDKNKAKSILDGTRDVRAVQYDDNGKYDLSLIRHGLVDDLWK